MGSPGKIGLLGQGATLANVMHRLARIMALIGGIVLVLLLILVCVSVLGRGANTFGHWDTFEGFWGGAAAQLQKLGPVPGDFELVEAGIAFAIFAFLPLCQVSAGHATVDVFTSRMSARANQVLTAFWEVIFALVILLITWRLFLGLQSKFANGQTTFILEFPIWWAYAASFFAPKTSAK